MADKRQNCDKCGRRGGATWTSEVKDAIPQYDAYKAFRALCDSCATEVREARDSGAVKVAFQRLAATG